jgi:HEAT repeat protein
MFQFFRTADGGRLDEEAEQLPRLLREAHDVGRFDDVAQSCARAALRLIRTDLYPQAVGLIAALLDEMERADRTRILRESAEQALRRIGTAENVQHAAELLQHDAGARETLLRWLAFLGGEAVSQLEAVLFRAGDVELRRAVFRHLLPLEGIALRVVQRGLTDPSPARARIVLELASQPGIEPERALRWIAEGARHPDPAIRGEVARHAGAIGGRGAVRLLTGMLNDPDRGVRQGSIQGLGSVGDPSAVPFLGRVLADTGDEELPLAAIESLGKIGSPEAVPILLAVLHRRSLLAPKKLYRQKAAAIEALGRIPTPSAREALQGIAAGKDADLAADARRALSFLE